MELTLLQHNDSHGYLQAHPEFFWHGHDYYLRRTGGLARVAQFAKEERRKNQNVLLIDSGDLFHGTGPVVLSKGELLLPILPELKMDAYVPGNWDYAYGPKHLEKLCTALPFPAVAANVYHKKTRVPLLQPYTVKELKGIKLGIIGLTYPYVDQTMPPPFSEGLSFSLGLDEIPRYIEKLRQEEKVNLIVLVSHMGLPLDIKLASMIEGIDIILSGHSHDRLSRPIIQGRTLIIQSGASSSFIGKLNLRVDGNRILDFRHGLIPLFSDDFPEDESVSHMIQDALKPYEDLLSGHIGYTGSVLHRMTLHEAPMDKLITDAYLHATEADAAFSHGWRYGAPVPSGPITKKELFQMIPTDPQLEEISLSGEELLQALETNLEQVFAPDPFMQKGGYIIRSSGLMMAFKPYNPKGNRIEHIEVGNQPLKGNKMYRIIVGGSQVMKNIQSGRTSLGIRAHETIEGYLKQIKEFKADSKPQIISI